MPFFIIFLIIPLIEIALFIQVGDQIGLVSTLLLCVLTAALGGFLIRQQGLQTLFSVRGAMAQGQLPVQALFDGLCLAVAGALLLTPGFFTDAIGFSLLVPPVRRALFYLLRDRFQMDVMEGTARSEARFYRSNDVIEAEFERVDGESPQEKGDNPDNPAKRS